LKNAFEEIPGFAGLFGLNPKGKFYVRALRRVERSGPQGRVLSQAVLQITQTEALEDSRLQQVGTEADVTGGATLIVNTTTPGIDYVIMKSFNNADRNEMAVKTALGLAENSLRGTYFGGNSAIGEPFAIVHEKENE
jgi:hypothetical protein